MLACSARGSETKPPASPDGAALRASAPCPETTSPEPPPSPPGASACRASPYDPRELLFPTAPRVTVGASYLFFRSCMATAGAHALGSASECEPSRRRAVRACPTSSLQAAVGLDALMAPGRTRVGQEVLVRGRLAVREDDAEDASASVVLIGPAGRYGPLCSQVLLAGPDQSAGGASLGLSWGCRRSASGKACCDEDAQRPAVGDEVVVGGTITEQSLGEAAITWHVARMVVTTLCVPRSAGGASGGRPNGGASPAE